MRTTLILVTLGVLLPTEAVVAQTYQPHIKGRIAFHSEEPSNRPETGVIHIWDFDTDIEWHREYRRGGRTISDSVQLSSATATQPAYVKNPRFSHDGRYLAFAGKEKSNKDRDLFIYDFENDVVTNLSVGLYTHVKSFQPEYEPFFKKSWHEEDPSFHPSKNTHIVFKRRQIGQGGVERYDLWEVELNLTNPLTIKGVTRKTKTETIEESGPTYSVDGSSIYFWKTVGKTQEEKDASASILRISSAHGEQLVVDAPGLQDMFPAVYDGTHLLYTRWKNGSDHADDIYYCDIGSIPHTVGTQAEISAASNDSDPFPVDPASGVIGFSSDRTTGVWDLHLGHLTDIPAQVLRLGFLSTPDHDLGGSYTTNIVKSEDWWLNEDIRGMADQEAIAFEVWFQGDVALHITKVGTSKATNAFFGASSSAPIGRMELIGGNTRVRFESGVPAGKLPPDGKALHHFGIKGTGRLPLWQSKRWVYLDGGEEKYRDVPKSAFAFEYDQEKRSLQVAIHNASSHTVTFSEVGYEVADNALLLDELNRKESPPDRFRPLNPLDQEPPQGK